MATREETKAMMAVMQAYVDEKDIDAIKQGDGEWHRVDVPAWHWGIWDYRVKHEPREWWLACMDYGVVMCLTKEQAYGQAGKRFPVFHVREVLED